MRKTKIVCTLGPATESEEMLKKLMQAGMNVARFNFSHQTHEQHKQRLEFVRGIQKQLGAPLTYLLDTKGPELRLGLYKDNQKVTLKTGQDYTLTTRDILGDENQVSISFKGLPGDVKPGNHILIADGLIELEVKSTTETDILCRVNNAGTLSNNKNVNVPDAHVSLPFISEKDRSDLVFGVENGFDAVASSFTRSAEDVLEMRAILDSHGGTNIKIIPKIENIDGVNNIDEILKVADGVMVARGDMGVNIPIEEIPRIQKMIIKKANALGKITITATQMLDSMIQNPRPTRAEATDVANAIYDGTGATMLSGETAAGAYPIEAVTTMSRIAECTEHDIDYKQQFIHRNLETECDVTNAVAHAAVSTAHDTNAKAILTVTQSGHTARFISKFRPACPIIGCTPDEQVYRQLNLSFDVVPLLTKNVSDTDEMIANAVQTAMEADLLKEGDLVVITGGIPLGVPGTTNFIKVHVVGDSTSFSKR